MAIVVLLTAGPLDARSSSKTAGAGSKGNNAFETDGQRPLLAQKDSAPEGVLIYGKISVKLEGYQNKFGFYESGIKVTLREETGEAKESKIVRRFDVETGPGGCFHIIRPTSSPRPKISYTIDHFEIPGAGVSLPAGNLSSIGLGEANRKRKEVLLFLGHSSFNVSPRKVTPKLNLPTLFSDPSMKKRAVSCVMGQISMKGSWFAVLERELEMLRIVSRLTDFRQKGEYSEAHAILTEYVKENPDGQDRIHEQSLRVDLYVRQLKGLIEAGRMVETVEVLDDAAQTITDPVQGESIWQHARKIAEDFYKQKDYDRIIEVLNHVISLSPDLEEPYYGRARAWFRKSEYERSISDLTKVTELYPKSHKAYFYRALAEESLGRYEQAISDLNRFIEMRPDLPAGHNSLAWILATCPKDELRNGDRAIEEAKKAVKLKLYSKHLDTLAAAYAEAGQYQEAVSTQKRAISLVEKEEKGKDLDELEKRLRYYQDGKPWRTK